MKFIFKKGEETLKSFNVDDVEMLDTKALQEEFDHKPIKEFKITFKEGTKVGECHSVENINPEKVESITIEMW